MWAPSVRDPGNDAWRSEKGLPSWCCMRGSSSRKEGSHKDPLHPSGFLRMDPGSTMHRFGMDQVELTYTNQMIASQGNCDHA